MCLHLHRIMKWPHGFSSPTDKINLFHLLKYSSHCKTHTKKQKTKDYHQGIPHPNNQTIFC